MYNTLHYAMQATKWLKAIAAIGIIAGAAYLLTIIPEGYGLVVVFAVFGLAIVAILFWSMAIAEPLMVDIDDK